MNIQIFLTIFFALLAAYALRHYEYRSPMWWFSLVIVVFNSLTILDYAMNL
jgi:ABC-type glycerol-3-phosphate transport system permease component